MRLSSEAGSGYLTASCSLPLAASLAISMMDSALSTVPMPGTCASSSALAMARSR